MGDKQTEDLMFVTLEILNKHSPISRVAVWDLLKDSKDHPLFIKQNVFDAVDSHQRNGLIEWEKEPIPGNQPNFITLDKGKRVYEKVKASRDKKKRKTELEDRLLSTSVNSNKMSPIWAAVAAIMAIGTVTVSILDYNKSNEKLKPALLRIDSTMRMRVQSQDTMLQRMRNDINDLHHLVDSLNSSRTRKP